MHCTMKSVVTLIISALILTGCSTSQITGSWSEPGLASGGFQHILVIGVTDSDMVKRTYEDMMVVRVKGKGVQASPSYSIMNADEKLERDVILKHLQMNNIDGVMITQLIDKRTETAVSPGQTSVRSSGYYGDRHRYSRWYPMYSSSYDITHTPTTIHNYDVLTIETTLYKIQGDQERPAWSAQSETAPGGNLNDDLNELADKLIKDMSSQGVF